jgi:trans-2,3-dihydro-3-hydroxyanthranilate isomerase
MAIELRYRIVDVFSDRPLAGNALCVVLDPCPEPVMKAIAREVNLSETTFPVVTDERAYEMRIFTPSTEMPFAGHPSLGTAWALGPGRWTQTTEGATVAVEADAGGAVMTQPDPLVREVDAAGPVAALGLGDAEGAFVADLGGTRHVLVPTRAPIERLAPDPSAVAAAARAAGGVSLCPFRPIDDETLHARVFAPLVGVTEDPGTGSAAGALGLVAGRLWGTAPDLVVHQGLEMGRPCRIEVHVEHGSMRVGGRVTPSAEGRFTL